MSDRWKQAWIAFLIAFAIVILYSVLGHAQVFDGKDEKAWFDKLSSCCGLGDAFVADNATERDGKFYAIITDGTDRYLHIEHAIPIGTQYEIPKKMFDKIKDFPPNPTHHGIVFVRVTSYDGVIRGYRTNTETHELERSTVEDADVICYFPPALS